MPRLTITPRAVDVLARIRSELAPPAGCELRVRVVGGGCAGFVYDLYYDQVRDGDERETVAGLAVLLDPLSRLYVDELAIDYAEGDQPGFLFKSPRASATCACGASFRP
jgi:iron-sulfur cluster insertion protein